MTAPGALDFRSDTRTSPDAEMRAAMAAAEVGDDAYGDDPSVLELEAAGARLLGTEAALFLPSSTMANLVAVLAAIEPEPPAERPPGDRPRLLTGADTHIARFETEAMRRFAGAEPVALPQRTDGSPAPAALVAALRGGARRNGTPTGARTVVSLENTCMLHNGNALDAATLHHLAATARRYAAHVHLDGARLANAAVALNLSVAELAAPADSVTFCLAKGLGAPVGSLLCGRSDYIGRARTQRLHLGGTMHQSGVLAAAALTALRRIPDLTHDHAVAAALATGLTSVPDADVPEPPHRTNIVTVRLPNLPAPDLAHRLSTHGVQVLPLDAGFVRFVTHRGHDLSAIPTVVQALERAARAPSPGD